MKKAITGKEILVYSAPVNDATKKWGVYAIPRMWRELSGELVIRLNGEQDTAHTDKMMQAPVLYFVSNNNGESWSLKENTKYDINMITGIGSMYYEMKNGKVIALRCKGNLKPIENVEFKKEFEMPNGEAIVHSYPYGDIPNECKGIELLRYIDRQAPVKVNEINLDFAEREILVNAKAAYNNGNFEKIDEYVKPFIFKNPYFSDITELDDGILVALTCGQNPDVDNRYCGIVYLIESDDGGITWRKRGVVASNIENLPYGYGGDGYEVSLTKSLNGDLLCVMRMDMSINPNIAKPVCGTMLAVSHDSGFTWDEPVLVSDSSVTPHIVTLKNGVIVIVYGRPGVHYIYSEDNGKSWSKPQSIIGKTLEEERALGRSDADSKYFDSCSYSNSFVEKISDNSLLVCYNNLKYDEGDGICHKAVFVRTITIE